MIESFSPTAVRLVRNPRFSEWSQLARPDGYPDEIDWSVGASANDLLEMVVDGSTEAMTIELPPPNPGRLDQLQTQFPARTHSTIVGTAFLYLNTLQKPFDDARVRQAISYAIDRGRLADQLGGNVAARVTCQVLAPTLPGYSPYCPYTINDNVGGTWSGANIAKARELMTAARPSKVDFEILTFPRFAPAAESIAESLSEIGLHATVRIAETPFAVVAELADPIAGPKVPAAIHVWIPDIRSTLDQVYPILECGKDINFTRYCDATIDEAVRNAVDVQQHDPSAARQAWAAADRTIVDLAPAAPLVNIVYTDFVGAGVGNYQFHPQWGPLYDQFWVK
jgi:peptide/nickel transport system substrate-binding protein